MLGHILLWASVGFVRCCLMAKKPYQFLCDQLKDDNLLSKSYRKCCPRLQGMFTKKIINNGARNPGIKKIEREKNPTLIQTTPTSPASFSNFFISSSPNAVSHARAFSTTSSHTSRCAANLFSNVQTASTVAQTVFLKSSCTPGSASASFASKVASGMPRRDARAGVSENMPSKACRAMRAVVRSRGCWGVGYSSCDVRVSAHPATSPDNREFCRDLKCTWRDV